MDVNIKNLQSSLQLLGFDCGPVDGLWGVRTQQAMMALISSKNGPMASAVASASSGKVIYQGGSHAPVHEIIIHCAATPVGWMEGAPLEAKIAEITAWHKARGFRTIGYHWVIDRDGRILPGRAETEIGAHVEGHNTGTIGISLVGGATSNENDVFSKNYTVAQEKALRNLIAEIKLRTPITKVSGHNEYSAKACPGFTVSKWL